GKADITIRLLLAHASGLPAWRPYYREVFQQDLPEGQENFLGAREAREHIYTLVQCEPLAAPPGQRAVYSDLDFISLGAIVEKLSGMELDQYCQEEIFSPLGLQKTSFINLEKKHQGILPFPLEQVAPTERCLWRNRILCAEVHDDNAYAMGG